MNSEPTQPEWYYLVGVEVRGPVSLEQLSALVAGRTLSATVMAAAKGSAQWRPLGEVLNECRATRLSHPDLPPFPAKPPRSLLDQIGETISQVAGTEKLEGFSLHEMFSETFKKRPAAETEEYLIVGTPKTTPKITEVETGWPKPWLFARFLLIFGGLYFGFVLTFRAFLNPNLTPGLILMGSATVPLATLILFFELNTPRNISLYRLMVLVGFGGILSMFISLIGYNLGRLDWLGASSAGIIEELGKLATLILLVRGSRYKYILNGMLFGAAVGAGFAIFESAGYALRVLLDYFRAYGYGHFGYENQVMMNNIAVRGMLAPLMHIAWTAMVGAALWRTKKNQPITVAHLGDPKFYRILIVAVVLHMLWNSPVQIPFYVKELALGAVAWFIIWGLVQQGLRQVRDEQREMQMASTEPPAMPMVSP
jgi:RsiW-degrading membrane proteinase PrsW (M82 family)